MKYFYKMMLIWVAYAYALIFYFCAKEDQTTVLFPLPYRILQLEHNSYPRLPGELSPPRMRTRARERPAKTALSLFRI